MSLLLTLFGGMLVTAALYGLSRRFGLSNFWAAVTAAVLPSMAYLAYAAGTWPGLDVITIHIVLYPTVAVLLNQLYGSKAEHDKSMHWAPKVMIAFFSFIIVICGALVYIAVNGLPEGLARQLLPNAEGRRLHTGFAGVVAHHEEAAKTIGAHMMMEDRLSRQGWRLDVAGVNDLQSGRPGDLTVKLRDKQGQGVSGVEVRIIFARPGDDTGPAARLDETAVGEYRGASPALEAGVWVAQVELTRGKTYIALQHTMQVRE